MVSEVRIYCEGGGNSKDTKAAIRRGFSKFLSELKKLARERRINWKIIACGPRQETFNLFKKAQEIHSNAFNILLVDAEGAVSEKPWLHLQDRDGWDSQNISDEHCHLMVQMMEAWIVADVAAMESYYGDGFRRNVIPKQDDVEAIDKATLERSFKDATRRTQKGQYHKIRHGPDLLCIIDPRTVLSKARHCERLFTTLEAKIRYDD